MLIEFINFLKKYLFYLLKFRTKTTCLINCWVAGFHQSFTLRVSFSVFTLRVARSVTRTVHFHFPFILYQEGSLPGSDHSLSVYLLKYFDTISLPILRFPRCICLYTKLNPMSFSKVSFE